MVHVYGRRGPHGAHTYDIYIHTIHIIYNDEREINDDGV
jgi:hypothetical protein